jgi:multiple sugar transport system substrate-binding protein
LLSRRRFVGSTAAALAGAALAQCRSRTVPPVAGVTSDERAVLAARQLARTTLNVASETGAQAQGLLRYSAPLWEELTGMRVNVVEIGLPAEMERRLAAEHAAGTGAIDCASVAPAWLRDLVDVGVLEPLDSFVDRYARAADFADYLPRYRELGCVRGRRYGLFDDGDALLLYYRRDLFEDEAVRASFAARFGRPLGDPRVWTWDEFVDAARFFTDPPRGRYGLSPYTQDLLWGWFQMLLHARGGRFFDPDTMRAELAIGVGRQSMADLMSLSAWTPPGGFGEGDPLLPVSTWLSGTTAMATFWPPLARWAEGYGPRPSSDLPPSQVRGRTGYALLPGGRSQLSVGFVLAVMARSPRKEAAYLFAQWQTSPAVSLQRVMLPYGLRDPYRVSHITSPAYRALWPTAPAYLDTLAEAADRAWLDLGLAAAADYAAQFQIAVTELRMGGDLDAVLMRLAAAWNAITAREGRRAQRREYRGWLAEARPPTTP